MIVLFVDVNPEGRKGVTEEAKGKAASAPRNERPTTARIKCNRRGQQQKDESTKPRINSSDSHERKGHM
jgi:hypothetical protein